MPAPIPGLHPDRAATHPPGRSMPPFEPREHVDAMALLIPEWQRPRREAHRDVDAFAALIRDVLLIAINRVTHDQVTLLQIEAPPVFAGEAIGDLDLGEPSGEQVVGRMDAPGLALLAQAAQMGAIDQDHPPQSTGWQKGAFAWCSPPACASASIPATAWLGAGAGARRCRRYRQSRTTGSRLPIGERSSQRAERPAGRGRALRGSGSPAAVARLPAFGLALATHRAGEGALHAPSPPLREGRMVKRSGLSYHESGRACRFSFELRKWFSSTLPGTAMLRTASPLMVLFSW